MKHLLKILIAIIFCIVGNICCAQFLYSTTAAGDSARGFSGDGSAATSACLNLPFGVAVDSFGNIYIADSYNNRIRKVNTSGIITTIAGNGIKGYSGDGNIATKASLYFPTGVAVDNAGNIFIADWWNNRIRKVNTNGIISTVAGDGFRDSLANGHFGGDGGIATNAGLDGPICVTVDNIGNLYISEYVNNRIRKVNRDGIISTIAGNGSQFFGRDVTLATSTRLTGPGGLFVDSVGKIYIAMLGRPIRKITTQGIIKTIAGTNDHGTKGDGGPAILASFGIPYGIVLDASGNIYVSDVSANRIRKISTDGIIETIVNDSSKSNLGESFHGDGGLASSAGLASPFGIAIDKAGNLYIADAGNSRIRKVSVGGIITTIAGGGYNGLSKANEKQTSK